MLGSCRCNAPARSSCFRTKLTIGCTIHYTGNSTLPIRYTTLFLVYGLPFWVTQSDPSICIVNCCYRGCRQQSLCKGLQSTNTGVFSDQVRKVTKHPVGGSLGLGGCFLLILLILLTMVSRWMKLCVLHESVTKSLQENKPSTRSPWKNVPHLEGPQVRSVPWVKLPVDTGELRQCAQLCPTALHSIPWYLASNLLIYSSLRMPWN